MNKETREFLSTVQQRIIEIPEHLKRGIYQPSKPEIVDKADFAARTFISRSKLINPKPVEEAAKKASDGQSSWVVMAHRSNADNVAIPYTVAQYGLGPFARSWTFLMGIKMWEDKFTRGFQGCINTILTISPLEDALFKRMLANPQEFDLQQKHITLLNEYKPLKESLVSEGFKKTLEMQQLGVPIATYPEATRSRTGKLQRAPREIAALFMKPAWVLPLTASGTEKIFPVWSPAPIWRGPVTVTAGELVRTDELVAKYLKNRSEFGRVVTVADYIMAEIAYLDPGRVPPTDLALYRKLKAA